ncbi:MAG TPA: SCO1664 family protein [Iamia sp.]|nr:SCO1664 family protein [Iamia sp.]
MSERAPEPLDRLRHGPIELLGRIVDSSNGTFLVSVGEVGAAAPEAPDASDDDGWEDADPDSDTDTGSLPPGLKGVYKPLAGERPLWDFPEGLYRREIAAYELSVALGWDMVPATVARDDVLGVGSLQRFVEADFSRHYFVLRDEGRHDDQLLRMGVFDLLANNTDRKGGHVLVDGDEHVWGIDNGLCFSTEARLRTVIWDFAGEPIPTDLLDPIAELVACGPPAALTDLLLDEEVEQLLRRCRVVLSARQMPHDPTGRAIPWPLV